MRAEVERRCAEQLVQKDKSANAKLQHVIAESAQRHQMLKEEREAAEAKADSSDAAVARARVEVAALRLALANRDKACGLLARTFAPMRARLQELVLQKRSLSLQAAQLELLNAAVHDLLKATTAELQTPPPASERDAVASSSSRRERVSPTLIHAPHARGSQLPRSGRVSLRGAVLAVMAANRLQFLCANPDARRFGEAFAVLGECVLLAPASPDPAGDDKRPGPFPTLVDSPGEDVCRVLAYYLPKSSDPLVAAFAQLTAGEPALPAPSSSSKLPIILRAVHKTKSLVNFLQWARFGGPRGRRPRRRPLPA